MYQTTLAAHRTEMSQFLLEASHRNTVDSLAKVTKELPEGTTCVNMAWGLSCLMEQSLEKHMYDPTADTPSQVSLHLYLTIFLTKHTRRNLHRTSYYALTRTLGA